jgi:hypothetical protein
VSSSREQAHKLRVALERWAVAGQLVLEAARALEESLPPEPDESSTGGRPAVAPTLEQRVEVVRVKYANGRIGLRRIAELVNKRLPPNGKRKALNWEHVQAILADYETSENPP